MMEGESEHQEDGEHIPEQVDVRLTVHGLTPHQAAAVAAKFANIIVGFAADEMVCGMIVSPSTAEITDFCEITREEDL